MINKTYADFAWEQTDALLAIDSPSGYTAKAVEAGYSEQKITTTVPALKKKYKKTLESMK